MLTTQEIAAAKSSKCFDNEAWGTVKHGLCPAGKVAELRGAVFKTTTSGYMWMGPLTVDDKAHEILQEVALWLGFIPKKIPKDDYVIISTPIEQFLAALHSEREKIFNRATY